MNVGLVRATAILSLAALSAAAPPTPSPAPIFPNAVAPKYASLKPGEKRMKTCLDQYTANKPTGANGGLKWIQKGGGYYSLCLKKLKSQKS